MNDREIFINMIKDNLNDMNNTIDFLYVTSNSCTKNKLLNQMRRNIANLNLLVQGLQNDKDLNINYNNEIREFTQEGLSRYNGKDGNPAYVAVNGIVYDVTNNAGWAGATHFGLVAGRDVTNEFMSCHTGQEILSKLKVVGKVVG